MLPSCFPATFSRTLLTAIGLSASVAADTLAVPGQHPTIQAAINIAVSGDTILVAPGVYAENVDFIGKELHLVSSQGPASTIIDGGMTGSVVRIASGEGIGTIVEGFTIQNGSGSSPAAFPTSSIGGGVYVGPNSHAIVRGNLIRQNGGSTGPAIAIERGQAVVEDNEISSNLGFNDALFVWENTGGPTIIQGNEIHSHLGTFEVIRLNFASGVELRDNVIRDNAGDGVFSFSSNDVIVAGNTIANSERAGFHFWKTDDLIFSNNNLLDCESEGLFVRDCDDVEIRDVLADGCLKTGIYLWFSDNITVSDIVCRNNGQRGIYVWACTLVEISNLVTTRNQGNGMGIRTSTATLDRTTSYLNTGIGLVSSDIISLSVTNAIIWGNTENQVQSFLGGGPPSISYSCIEDGFAGIGNINVDPNFWSSQDLHLRPGSPCIDTGDPSSPLDGDGSIADMGAFEFDPTYSPPVQPFCTSTVNSSGSAAVIGTVGDPSVSLNNFALTAHGAAAQNFGLFYYGPGQTQVPFGDGFRCVSGSIARLPVLQTDSAGFGSSSIDLQSSPGIAAFMTQNFQFWFRDTMGPGGSGFNLSDGVSVTFCP